MTKRSSTIRAWKASYYANRDGGADIEFTDYAGRNVYGGSQFCENCGGNIWHGQHMVWCPPSATEPGAYECFDDDDLPY